MGHAVASYDWIGLRDGILAILCKPVPFIALPKAKLRPSDDDQYFFVFCCDYATNASDRKHRHHSFVMPNKSFPSIIEYWANISHNHCANCENFSCNFNPNFVFLCEWIVAMQYGRITKEPCHHQWMLFQYSHWVVWIITNTLERSGTHTEISTNEWPSWSNSEVLWTRS